MINCHRLKLTLPRLVTAITFIGVFTMATRASVDSDTGWHLRAGAWMVEHRQILTRDEFSSTRLGQPWIDHSWLSQIPMYLLWRAGGYVVLNLMTEALAMLAYALTWTPLLRLVFGFEIVWIDILYPIFLLGATWRVCLAERKSRVV